jgi:hypothetical protein
MLQTEGTCPRIFKQQSGKARVCNSLTDGSTIPGTDRGGIA